MTEEQAERIAKALESIAKSSVLLADTPNFSSGKSGNAFKYDDSLRNPMMRVRFSDDP